MSLTDYFIEYGIGMSAVFCTYFVNVKLRKGPVFASSFLTIVFYFILILIYGEKSEITLFLSKLFMGGTFVGMISGILVQKKHQLIFAGLIYTSLFVILNQFYAGFGGFFGAIACISLMVSFSIFKYK